ncbi:MAG: hypothetical protein U5L72_06820 [Bacteroidales bacterium]|nr:hypothetical protein [Bacteroidales bacterium]
MATDDNSARKTSEAVNVVVEKSLSAINQLPVVTLRGSPGIPRNPKRMIKLL